MPGNLAGDGIGKMTGRALGSGKLPAASLSPVGANSHLTFTIGRGL